ncbi:M20/M25/M40 family metallo-hydrolase [Acidomonas methanolica]|uniref:M20/M25/M40 family metallo-hydrolase n=1 Tax=Acidomonas methanolica TaxID=437 RepID=UPI00211A1466|nr:M20/M25/M40 family metallo-hydrolase [Acidomonas methanolica]MCQ9156282.1 M20/M25/M40 family metallo-hydrolase [Acidomonas methanolica]
MTAPSPAALTEDVLSHADAAQPEALERLFALLRIPSISAQPRHAEECRAAAQWLRDDLAAIGFDARVADTPGHPMVVAHDVGKPGLPHVLFYGHYDVQPVDPLSLWSSDPFAPAIVTEEDGRQVIVARGASDDKGQLMTFIEACRAWKQVHGDLPLNVSVLIEGEEESGGANLLPFLKAHAAELGAGLALICDTDMPNRTTPAITTALRGLVGEEVVIQCADRDLHSGMYGNAARNPIELLCTILATIRDETGRVTLPGFYDDVQLPSESQRKQWRALFPDDSVLLGPVGLSEAAGEDGFTAIEQVWCRPSFEINGISGGYEEDGFKTVLPAKAMAKISFRLVPGQDPQRIRAAFRERVAGLLPPDATVTFSAHGASSGFAVPQDGPDLRRALDALGEEWGVPAVATASGGSIPVVAEVKEALGIDSLLIGFAQSDDRIHSPNEQYGVENFRKGVRSWVRVLAALAVPG